jgi:hypothetical protein
MSNASGTRVFVYFVATAGVALAVVVVFVEFEDAGTSTALPAAVVVMVTCAPSTALGSTGIAAWSLAKIARSVCKVVWVTFSALPRWLCNDTCQINSATAACEPASRHLDAVDQRVQLGTLGVEALLIVLDLLALGLDAEELLRLLGALVQQVLAGAAYAALQDLHAPLLKADLTTVTLEHVAAVLELETARDTESNANHAATAIDAPNRSSPVHS